MPMFHRKDHPPAHVPTGTAPPHAADHDEDWRTYDSVAQTYGRTLERMTGPPSADLVRLLEIKPGAKVLDVGTGTGVGARAAAEAAGPTGVVIGVDPSLPMLRQAVGRAGGSRYAAAASIDLPFRDGAFGYLVASFVLSHFPKYETALFDMLRVLAPGGRMAASSWAAGEDGDDFSMAWQEVTEEFAEHEMLTDAHDRAVPWEERFSDPVALKEALHEAGLRDIWIEHRDYRVELTAEDYLAGREIASAGRFLRQMLGPDLWEAFRRRVREVFAERFPPAFNDFHQAILAVGHKP